jgi:hypothetical protein
MRIHLLLLGLLYAGAALAEPDAFGLGTGRSGPLRVDLPNTVINHSTQLTANAVAGTRDLTVTSSSGFTAGELVLLYQATGLLPAPASGDQRSINLGSSTVGRFEYARVAEVGPGSLRVTAPLQSGFAASVSQVVNVPEYTDVQVLSGASLKATAWDGRTGGILALLATGTLTNDGLVTVDGAGFRGGAFVNHASLNGCTGLDEAAGSGGSYKGEGIVAGRYGSAAGRGNLANGGGSGVCHSAGGAGGGHGGTGGKGGFTADGTRNVGGLGGAPVTALPYEHLVFGGGGGGGSGHLDFGTGGAAGGGVMLLRANTVAGAGRFSAGGSSADFVPSSIDDGAGGGGAGGAISVRALHGIVCGVAQAAGGAGGDTRHPSSPSGPGGGGAGGVVFLQAESLACPISVVAGLPGQSTASGGTFGAGPTSISTGGSVGDQQSYQVPYVTPGTPVVTEPENGATGLPARPRFEGTAEPGATVHLYMDGVPYGQTSAFSTGAFSFNAPGDLSDGFHEVQASSEVLGAYSPFSTLSRFEVGTGDGGVPDAGFPADMPILVVPQQGETVEPLPLFAGTSLSGAMVSIEVDGAEVGRVPLDDQRRFSYTLTAEQKLASGMHNALVRARDAEGEEGLSSAVTNFEVKPAAVLDVGCGCGASPGAGVGALALLLGLGAARLRRRG